MAESICESLSRLFDWMLEGSFALRWRFHNFFRLFAAKALYHMPDIEPKSFRVKHYFYLLDIVEVPQVKT
jgi:hypothetical protein